MVISIPPVSWGTLAEALDPLCQENKTQIRPFPDHLPAFLPPRISLFYQKVRRKAYIHHLSGFHFVLTRFVFFNRRAEVVRTDHQARIKPLLAVPFVDIAILAALTVPAAATPRVPHSHDRFTRSSLHMGRLYQNAPESTNAKGDTAMPGLQISFHFLRAFRMAHTDVKRLCIQSRGLFCLSARRRREAQQSCAIASWTGIQLKRKDPANAGPKFISTCRPCRRRRQAPRVRVRGYRLPGSRWSASGPPRSPRSAARCGSPWSGR